MVGLCNNVPCWLETLLGETFFHPCSTHQSARKNERNIFCLDCCSSFCTHCLPTHRSHGLLQIRRYVYQDVIRVDDLQKLIDCALVQPYTTNSAKVVFINERPQARPFRSVSGHVCVSCRRPLQQPFLFCSLSCKVKHLEVGNKGGGGATRYLYDDCNFLPLPTTCDTDDGQLTPDAGGSAGFPPQAVLLKKRSGFVGSPCPAEAAFATTTSGLCSDTVNRRKGAPTRSPLY